MSVSLTLSLFLLHTHTHFLSVFLNTYTHTHTHTHIFIYIHTCTHTHTRIYIYILYIYIYTRNQLSSILEKVLTLMQKIVSKSSNFCIYIFAFYDQSEYALSLNFLETFCHQFLTYRETFKGSKPSKIS